MQEIDYPVLIEETYLNLAKKALSKISEIEQFGKKNYFYISFLTKYPGVILADRLRKRYPDEMTIILQYEFYDLKVSDDCISVRLSFDNVLEHIEIPFKSITAFTDPYAQIHLEFHPKIPKKKAVVQEKSDENLIYFGK
ncbi:MAG: ClpXP protease specificity-enhancing factor SspB [Alphaproteobacteria bacterium]|nr:ClpXP protease specificity-enhancing factor SspB [Alphaproteobacteria bacterium]